MIRRIRKATNIVRLRKNMEKQVAKEMKDLHRKLHRKKVVELETEILVASLFVIVSGYYVATKYGMEKIIDAIFLWMLPASITILLTLIVILAIEGFKEK